MRLNQNLIAKFQEGGEMGPQDPAMQGAPVGPEASAEQAPQGPSPEEQLQQLAGDLVGQLMQMIGDPQAVVMVLQMALEMAQSQGAPQPAAFRRNGGKITRIR